MGPKQTLRATVAIIALLGIILALNSTASPALAQPVSSGLLQEKLQWPVLLLRASTFFGYGTGPQRHYPLKITIYVTNASTNITTPVNMFLRDENTACLKINIDQPHSCVS